MEELQRWLGTRVHNHLSLLLRHAKIRRFSLARHAVYTSADPAQEQRQQAARQPSATTADRGLAASEAPSLPPGMQPMELIRLLLQMLHQPAAGPAALAKSLQAQGLGIHAAQIREVIRLYGLKKTTR